MGRLLEILAQPIEAGIPLAAACFQPPLGLHQGAGVEPASPDPSHFLGSHQPAGFENLHVLHDGRQ